MESLIQSSTEASVDSQLSAKNWQLIARRVFDLEMEAMRRVQARLDGAFDKAVECIANNQGKVVLLGIGKSGLVAQKMTATLCSTGTPAVFLHAAEAVHGDLGIYHPSDPTILISKSGSTSELLRLIPVLKEFKSPLIGMLGNVESPMAAQMDIVLDVSVPVEADPLGIVPTSSALVAMAMGDALASALMEYKNFQKHDFARYHPAGQLGRGLSMCVKDVMHCMDKVAIVDLDTSLKEVVIALSEYPLGAACVLNPEGELLGIITDGDIRRALKNFDDIRCLQAKDVMTTKPTHTFPEVSLIEAVKQMEDRPSQIAVLPVMAPGSCRCLGLVRLHDAYQPGLG